MSEFPKHTLAYLATPYTKYRAGLPAACGDAIKLAGQLIRSGINVYCPIAYCHPIAIQCGLNPLDLSIWMAMEQRMCFAADVLIVAHLDGWEESDGIAREVHRFTMACKPIFDLDPDTMRMSRRAPPPLAHGKSNGEHAGAP